MYVQSIVEGNFMQTSMHTISGRCLSSIVLRIVTIFLQISAHDWLLISAQGTNEVYGNVWVHLGTIVCFLKWKRCILKLILAWHRNCKCNWPHDRVFRCEQYNRYASSVTLTFKNWAIHGINFISFLLFDSVDSIYKLCRWLDLNSEPLVFEATALPIEQQKLPPITLTLKRLTTKLIVGKWRSHLASTYQ